MPIALTPAETFEYQLKCDRLPDGSVNPDATVFVFKPLTVQGEAQIQNRSFVISAAGQLEQFNLGSNILARLEFGLKGWRNFKDAAGVDVPFSIDALSRLSPAHRTELSDAHRAHYSLTPEEGN